MHAIDEAERRARLATRHALARRARSIEDAAAAMVGLHSSDPATVFLSARARVTRCTPASVERALYERRSLLRVLGMRRTLFVTPTAFAPVIDAACTQALAPPQRRRLVAMLEDQGVADDAAGWLDDVCVRTLAALDARGEASARTLTGDVPELSTKLTFGEGTRWAAEVGLSTRVLFLLATQGRIVRVRPAGSWTSGQYRWAPIDRWIGEAPARIDRDEACAQLLRRYLAAFGPATTVDLRWWTGWTARLTAATLDAIGAIEVRLADGSGWVLPDDLARVRRPARWVAFLPSLDPTTMGWKERDWYLGEHAGRLFDRNGNAGPTVWADGRVVGGWAQAADGEVRVRLLERMPAATSSAIETERERLGAWLGDARVRPRFRTPLERELTG